MPITKTPRTRASGNTVQEACNRKNGLSFKSALCPCPLNGCLHFRARLASTNSLILAGTRSLVLLVPALCLPTIHPPTTSRRLHALFDCTRVEQGSLDRVIMHRADPLPEFKATRPHQDPYSPFSLTTSTWLPAHRGPATTAVSQSQVSPIN